MSRFCEKCGNQLNDDDMFCPKCGTTSGVQNAAPVKQHKALEKKKFPCTAVIAIVLAVAIAAGGFATAGVYKWPPFGDNKPFTFSKDETKDKDKGKDKRKRKAKNESSDHGDTISHIDLKVAKEGDGIAISANAKEFTDTLTFKELQGTATGDESAYNAVAADYNYFPMTISAASSEFTLNTMPVFYSGGIDNTAKMLYVSASTSSDGRTIYRADKADSIAADGTAAGFCAFDVFVRLEDADTARLKISKSAIGVTADPDAAGEEDNAGPYDGAAKAMRMGFVNCGTTTTENRTPSGEEAVIFGLADSDAGNTAPINNAGEYVVADCSSVITGLGTKYACPVDRGSEDVTLTLSGGVNQIRVYIWMEGQDVNCTNNLMSEYISANIVFSMV